MKRKIHYILNDNSLFLVFIQSLIISNVIAVMLESVQYLHTRYRAIFYWFEVISVLIFTVEYLAQIWAADLGTKKPIKSRLKFIFSFLGLIDLFAVLPFYLPFLISFDLRFLRIMRLARMLRILKIDRFSNALILIKKVFLRKKDELFLTLILTILILLIASFFMFYVEHAAQPEKFTNIFQAFWWGISILTGYSDIQPITFLGKLLRVIISILNIGLVALPTGIISSGFIETIKSKKQRKLCPHCGKGV